MSELTLKTIARVRNDFTEKFGVPRQAGLTEDLISRVVFEPEYANADALRGLEGFSHIWLIWGFHLARREGWSPTVRPPRLGGNARMGVFATRSPFRPNDLGLSCVKLLGIDGTDILVGGADMIDGTPVYDIKPYLPYADCRPGASGGYTDALPERRVEVDFPEELLRMLPEEKRPGLLEALSYDPRPSYQSDPGRAYGLAFGGFDIRFRVAEGKLSVFEVLAK